MESIVRAPTGSKPLATVDAAQVINDVVKADLRVQERCRMLGYPDMNLVVAEGMVLHNLGVGDSYGNLTRPYQVFMYGRKFPTDNYYGEHFPLTQVL